TRIREFDSVSQRGLRDLQFVELGSAASPVFLGRRNTLFDYLPGAQVAIDDSAAAERARFLSLVADASTGRKGKAETKRTVVVQSAWDAGMGKRKVVDLSAGKDERVIRFASLADPVKAMNAEIAEAMKAKARVVIAGNEHDLRFIQKRLGKLSKSAR